MCTLLPVSGGYIHYAGRFLDPSARFAAGCELTPSQYIRSNIYAIDNTILGGISFVCFELTGKCRPARLNGSNHHHTDFLSHACCLAVLASRSQSGNYYILWSSRSRFSKRYQRSCVWGNRILDFDLEGGPHAWVVSVHLHHHGRR